MFLVFQGAFAVPDLRWVRLLSGASLTLPHSRGAASKAQGRGFPLKGRRCC